MTVTETQQSGRQRDEKAGRRAGAFDIRTFIGLLIGLYGVVLVIDGLVGTSDAELARAGGMNINLEAGIGMVVAAAAFFVWAKVRPVVVRVDDSVQREPDA